MAVDEILVTSGEGNVDVQVGGPGNNWKYLSACAALSGPTVPRGDVELRWCQDPNRAGGYRISSKIRGAPDPVTGELMTKLGKVDYLVDLNCPFGLRARFAKCAEREDPANYDPFMLSFCNVELTEHSYADLVAMSPDDNDEILVTAPWSADYEGRVKKMFPSRIGTLAGLGDQPINDIDYCDEATCGGYCGVRSDGCTIAYGVTDVDVTPYAAPNLIKYVKNLTTSGVTFTNNPILGLNNNVEGVECAGARLVVSSNGDSAIAYNDDDGDPDSWNIVVLANAPTASHNALFFRTAREGYVGCVGGYIYKSVDGGSTWTAVYEATDTTENINAVFAYDRNLVFAVGDNGVILRSNDGGQTWADITETSSTGANLLVVVVPPNRPKEVFIGTNDGQIFRSVNEGGTLAATGDFSAVSFTGDGVGTVDDLAFCGPCAGEVMFILHNDAGPRARILRDLSGGAGGADVEVVMDFTQVIDAGIDLNALACCSANEIIAAGENFGGFPVVVKAS